MPSQSVVINPWHLSSQQEQLTPEEQLAEKLRVKKLQEDADLELAKDAFGETGSSFIKKRKCHAD